MKTYNVFFGKKELVALIDAGERLGKNSSSFGPHTIIKSERFKPYAAIAVFPRKRAAYEFAIWAGGWVAAYYKNGEVPHFFVA